MSIVSVLSVVVGLVTATNATFVKPEPAPNYYSWYSEEIAEGIMEAVVADEYYPHLDFDGDGILSVIDAVAVRKRYMYNVLNGNIMGFGESDVMEIVEENFSPDEYNEYFYYEIDFVNGSSCRAYEMYFSKPSYIHVYMEMNGKTADFSVLIRPDEESYQVY